MQCLKCGSKMGIRTGKFGKFYYCQNACMTINVEKYEKIIAKIKDIDSLQTAIEIETAQLGMIMTDFDRFYIDVESYYADPNDFWQNVRLY